MFIGFWQEKPTQEKKIILRLVPKSFSVWQQTRIYQWAERDRRRKMDNLAQWLIVISSSNNHWFKSRYHQNSILYSSHIFKSKFWDGIFSPKKTRSQNVLSCEFSTQSKDAYEYVSDTLLKLSYLPKVQRACWLVFKPKGPLSLIFVGVN